MKSFLTLFVIEVLFSGVVSAGTISVVTPASGSTVYAAVGATSANVWFNVGGSGSGYPYLNIYKFVVKLDGNTIFNNPNLYPQFYSTVSGIGNHTVFVEMWEDNYLGQHVLTTTRTTSFTLETSYSITAQNSFGAGGSMKIDAYLESDIPAEGVTRSWGKNATHTLEAIDNQTINNLLRTWKQWTYSEGSTFSNLQFSTSVSSATTFVANFNSQPTAPTSFQNNYSTGNVTLSWAANPESDISNYEVERHVYDNGGWVVIATTTNTSFTDTEFDITNPRWATHTAEYRVRAKSSANLYSAYSSIVNVEGISHWAQKRQHTFQELPTEFSIEQNYPNPFNPTTEIKYSIAVPSFVTVIVFNSAGQEVSQLVKENKGIGNYTITWNAVNLPSGVYFYSFTAGKFSSQKKMMLVK